MIRIENVNKTYRSGRGKVHALADVSCTIAEGAAAALVGKSGSGKTTLLNCIGGLELPDAGRIQCFGQYLSLLSGSGLSRYQRRRVGFIFQHGNLFSYLTVRQNIAFPLNLNGFSKPDIAERVEGLLERIGLSRAGDAMPHELSGGEMQRVAAARAMAHSPALLLADEPTASLDSETAGNLVRLMFEIGKENNCTMVISTHDPDVFHLAEQVIHLKDGRIQEEE